MYDGDKRYDGDNRYNEYNGSEMTMTYEYKMTMTYEYGGNDDDDPRRPAA
eukprot:CAMPEP_0172488936 /NCGR_PEP_ID=MMETSP1066-20121228/18660_1 /TAXON_ID=671091 /ORGANISM="Coscinodiscus wailesii, Strain CCMP2513" /LENGTH=49 /DNA_ID=CAMNT_0013256461 /DNA_START=56 /DNA_END=205 /DNA_ORIENTATION=+